MKEQGSYSMEALAQGVWAIEMQGVRAFLVTGEVSALLIDTGAGGVDIKQAVLSRTDLPVRIVNTHAHYDHISGNGAFDMQFAHHLEIGTIAKAGYRVEPVSDGGGFDLGGRMLRVVGLPGHSPGSIGLWDERAGLLFAGDTVARGRPVFLALEGASVEAYLRSLDRILTMGEAEGGRVERIFCAHGDVECPMDTVERLKALVVAYMEGKMDKAPLPERYAAMLPEGAGIVSSGDVSLLVP